MNRIEPQIAANGHRAIPLADLLRSIDALSPEDRVALLKHLQTQDGFSVVADKKQITDALLWQINRLDRQQLGDLLQVIAFRIARE